MSDTPHVAHHFSTATQQQESAKLGMWIFLLTEVLLFGGLFAFYSFYRSWNPDLFYDAHKFLNITLGTINTVILIVSSLTIALAIHYIRENNRQKTILFLVVTLILAFTFLVIKYFEYSHKFHLGQLPGKYYTFTGLDGTNPHVFFSVYFVLTGLHALHVIAGIVTIGWILRRTVKNHFSAQYYTPVELAGLYWHLVDLIWIYLFPLLYLIG
jgi:cytochrome c oxidase subunit 3